MWYWINIFIPCILLCNSLDRIHNRHRLWIAFHRFSIVLGIRVSLSVVCKTCVEVLRHVMSFIARINDRLPEFHYRMWRYWFPRSLVVRNVRRIRRYELYLMLHIGPAIAFASRIPDCNPLTILFQQLLRLSWLSSLVMYEQPPK